MIPLVKIRDDAVIHENFRGADRVKLNLELLEKKRAGEIKKGSKWKSSIWGASRPQLIAETNGKCAYCESPSSSVSYVDVEHFRPKSVYWWLAYCYENYLASCTLCNQKYKKAKFPLKNKKAKLKSPRIRRNNTDNFLQKLAPQVTIDPVNELEGKSWQEFEDEIINEQSLLLNPYIDTPKDYLAYEANTITGEVKIVPLRPELNPIIKACEDTFGINRKELLDLRFEKYFYYMTFRKFVNHPNIPQDLKNDAQKAINKMESNESTFAGMIRYFNEQDFNDLPSDFNV